MSRVSKFVFYIFIGLLVISLAGILLYKGRIFDAQNSTDSEQKLPAIKVILTNGCGFEGLAREFSDFLADKNIDVVSMGNTRKPIYDKTIIVVRRGDGEDLKRLQAMTGIARFTEARNASALADFEIIIGRDFEQYTKKRR